MQSFFILYSALAAFGIGVTIVDLFGVFEHAGGDHDGGDHDGDGHDGDSNDGGHVGDHDSGGHSIAMHHDADHAGHDRGSYVASADSGTRFIAGTISALRTGVYFSLGAGPTGLFAVLTGVGPWSSLAWSAGAGIFIAALARALRAFVRKDLDSSIKPEEYIMDEATITVPVMPGAMGKAAVRRYGTQTELFVRAKDATESFSKGSKVRIIDFDDECYWIETF